MLTIVTWLWAGKDGQQRYNAEHVNVLQRMVAANLNMPHEFVCITDTPQGINCRVMPIEDIGAKALMPGWPDCYNRLLAFADNGYDLGSRFASIDLDCVITGDITEIFTRNEEFIILEGKACHYNGSLWMMDKGARRGVWENFDPVTSPILAMHGKNANGTRFFGSDQAWISYWLGEGEATWKLGEHGLYQFAEIKTCDVPADARMVFFAGDTKPWTENPLPDLRTIYNKYKPYKGLLG